MFQIVKKSSRALRISLVLAVLATGFATHAFAAGDDVVVSDTIAVDQRGMPVAGYLGNLETPELVPATYVDRGNGKVTTTYEMSYTNTLPHPYQFRIGLFMIFDPTITIDNYTVTAQGNAPAFDPVPVGGGMGGIQRIYADAGGGYSPPSSNKNRVNIIPANTTYTYIVKIDSTESARTTPESTKCIRVNNRDEGRGSYNYARGGRELTAWVDIFESRNAAGQPIPDRMGMSLDAVAHGCADTANVVVAPVTTAAPVTTVAPATSAPATNATTPATNATTPATNATVPQATNVTVPQYNGNDAAGSAGNGSHNGALNDTLGSVPASAPAIPETPLGAPVEKPAGTPQAPSNDVTNLPVTGDSVNFVDEVLKKSGSYAPSAASASISNAPGVDAQDTDVLGSLLGKESLQSHGSSSQNTEYVIAGLLVLCAIAALVTNKKFATPTMVMGNTPRVTLSPSEALSMPVSLDDDERLYNSHMHLVDLPAERELELVGASASSISSGASKASPRTRVDSTHDARHALPSRIWNELVSRYSRVKVNK